MRKTHICQHFVFIWGVLVVLVLVRVLVVVVLLLPVQVHIFEILSDFVWLRIRVRLALTGLTIRGKAVVVSYIVCINHFIEYW